MENEKKLYPISFCISEDDYSWGKEEFILADLGYKDSLVREGWLAANSISELMETFVDRLVGDNIYDFFGRQFPVCLRRLVLKNKLPLRVSPGDELSEDRYNFLGKERLWYISKLNSESKILLGFNKDSDASELWEKCGDNTVEGLLNCITVKQGDFYFIPSGVPFAAVGDMEIFEISESSPLDFTLCNWGNEIEGDDFDKSLSLEEALDFIDYKKFNPVELKADTLVSMPQFIVKKLKLETALHSETKEGAESFVLYTCIKGRASLQVEIFGQVKDFSIKEGDTILVPAECLSFNLVPLEEGSLLLETSVIARAVDSYLNS